MISKYFISLFALAASVPLAKSTPIEVTVLDAVAPKIWSPDKDDVLIVNKPRHLVWDNRNLPSQITNPLGRALLVKDGLIQFDHVLASGFNISAGRVLFWVPDVDPGPYQIDLFGDSGDLSEVFYIQRPPH